LVAGLRHRRVEASLCRMRLRVHRGRPPAPRRLRPRQAEARQARDSEGLAAARPAAHLRLRDAAPWRSGRGDRGVSQSSQWYIPRDRRGLPAARLPRRAADRPSTLGRSRRAARHWRAGSNDTVARAAVVTALQRAIKPAKARKRASTAGESAVTWILLKDALTFIANAYQDWEHATQILFKAFLDRQVRNRAARLQRLCIPKGQGKEDEPNLRLDDQWRPELFTGSFPVRPNP